MYSRIGTHLGMWAEDAHTGDFPAAASTVSGDCMQQQLLVGWRVDASLARRCCCWLAPHGLGALQNLRVGSWGQRPPFKAVS